MPVVIVGAGAAGLAAGLALRAARRPFVVLEAEDGPGGLGRTDSVDGFHFDRTGHLLHFKSPATRRRFERLGVPLQETIRCAAIFVDEHVVPYPFQYNLWALRSPDVAYAALAEMRAAEADGTGTPASFGDLITSNWGRTLTRLFFRPYNERLWGRALEELPPDCAGRYLPRPDVPLAESGARGGVEYRGYNAAFLYPASGRFGDVMSALAAPIGDAISYDTRAERIDLERRVVETDRVGPIHFDTLISTVPLGRLTEMCGIDGVGELFDATEILNVRIGIRGTVRAPYHWIYTVDEDAPFHRIGFPSNVSPRSCPPGYASLSVEYTLPHRQQRLRAEEVAEAALAFVSNHGFVEVEECLFVADFLISPAYVVHRAPGRFDFASLRRLLATHRIELAGRFGSWDYLSVEEAFDSGLEAAAAVLEASP